MFAICSMASGRQVQKGLDSPCYCHDLRRLWRRVLGYNRDMFSIRNPFPSIADAGYLMFYPLFAVGILLLPDEPLLPRERLKIFLDAAIVMVSAALVFWVFLIAPIVTSTEVITQELVISAAYPIMDLVLFFALISLLFRKLDSPGRIPALLLALGMILFFDRGCSSSASKHKMELISPAVSLIHFGSPATYR